MGPRDLSFQPEWDELMERGIRLRETGDCPDLYTSVDILKMAAEKAPTLADRMTAKNEEGLTHFHMGNYTEAVDTWNLVYTTSKVQTPQLLYPMAAALRNLSRKELCENEKDFEEAVVKANEAYDLAVMLYRRDLAWFAHGLFSAKLARMKLQKRYDGLILKELVGVEKHYLFKFWKKATLTEIGVWFGALLMDYAVVYNNVSRPLLKIARFISRALMLRRREEQITRLLDEMSY